MICIILFKELKHKHYTNDPVVPEVYWILIGSEDWSLYLRLSKIFISFDPPALIISLKFKHPLLRRNLGQMHSIIIYIKNFFLYLYLFWSIMITFLRLGNLLEDKSLDLDVSNSGQIDEIISIYCWVLNLLFIIIALQSTLFKANSSSLTL